MVEAESENVHTQSLSSCCKCALSSIFCRRNSETKKYCTSDLTDYFNNFAQKCEEGRYEELYDVSLFRHIGCDSAGLDLWL
jgi:hypothetical protein